MSNDYVEGVSDAASFLEGTARDYEEMAERLERSGVMRRHPADTLAIREYRAKSSLLKGQAQHIRNLPITKGKA